nr:hypothetical protein [uncultured Albidiferax sp.]
MAETLLNGNANRLAMAVQLWSEYEHRHTHCWSVLFQLTAAVVFLASVPYLSTTAALFLGKWILLGPLLSVILGGSGVLLLHRELDAFAKVKLAYRSLQSELAMIVHDTARKSRFSAYVLAYAYSLVVCAVVNAGVSWLIWLPAVALTGV